MSRIESKVAKVAKVASEAKRAASGKKRSVVKGAKPTIDEAMSVYEKADVAAWVDGYMKRSVKESAKRRMAAEKLRGRAAAAWASHLESLPALGLVSVKQAEAQDLAATESTGTAARFHILPWEALDIQKEISMEIHRQLQDGMMELLQAPLECFDTDPPSFESLRDFKWKPTRFAVIATLRELMAHALLEAPAPSLGPGEMGADWGDEERACARMASEAREIGRTIDKFTVGSEFTGPLADSLNGMIGVDNFLARRNSRAYALEIGSLAKPAKELPSKRVETL